MATNYVVLRRSSGRLFSFVGVREANGPAQAVRLLTDGQDMPEDSQLYVCVPERNWSIVPATVRQRDPELVVSEGDAAGFLRELSRSDETGTTAATPSPEMLPGGPDPTDEED